MISLVFNFFSDYLIEFMGAMLTVGLVVRYMAYRASKYDDVYFSTFTRELKLILDAEKDSEKVPKPSRIDVYLAELLGKVGKKLPNRSLRFSKQNASKASEPESSDQKKKTVSLRDYVDGKQGLISSIQSESSVFISKNAPNFSELTRRIMNEDKGWTKIMKHLDIEGVTRMIDILPSLFIVLGVFGTFIGISMALPEIAKIDFNDLEKSGLILNNFVLSVTYAMKTSIAGIFFSLILTVLNTMFPIKEVRLRIFKKVESSLQSLWYHIHSEESAEKQIALYLPQMVDLLQEIKEQNASGKLKKGA